MTQEKASAELPPYDHDSAQSGFYADEKQAGETFEHAPSQTPILDKLLSEPTTKARIQTIAAAINDLGDESKNTQSALRTAFMTVAEMAKDAKKEKKEGRWSKEDKKALKEELKPMFQDIKKEMKGTWKGRGWSSA